MLVVQSSLCWWCGSDCLLVVKSSLCVGGSVLCVCSWCGPHSVFGGAVLIICSCFIFNCLLLVLSSYCFVLVLWSFWCASRCMLVVRILLCTGGVNLIVCWWLGLCCELEVLFW